MCKKLVEARQGTISVRSVEGSGTLFEFTSQFGRCCADEDSTRVGEEVEEVVEEELPQVSAAAAVLPRVPRRKCAAPSKLHFLLVEDNAFNIQVIKSYFRNDTHITLDVAVNGKLGVEAYKKDHGCVVARDLCNEKFEL